MKQLLTTILLGAAALGAGVGAIVAAEHYGWIDRSGDGAVSHAAAEVCPHELAPAECPFCTPALIEELGWCSGHDVAEALCTRCNASLIPAFQAKGDWCAEHGLPESQCAICGGGAGGEIMLASNDATAGLPEPPTADAEFQMLRTQRLPSPTCQTPYTVVQLDSPEVTRRAGLAFEMIEPRTVRESVTGNAEIQFNAERYAHLAPRAAGTVRAVHVGLGERVEAGDVLAVIESTELGAAKAAYLQANTLVSLWERNHSREQALYEQNVGTEKDLLEAETRLVESQIAQSNARQRLRNLGLDEAAIALVAEENDTSSQLPLVAPFAGVVVERHAVQGEVVSTDRALFAIADMSTMWAMLNVYEADVPRLQPGQPVVLSVEGMPEREFTGKLTWISASVDPQTRTIRARAEIDNAEGLLRANMFGRGVVEVRTLEDALLVPAAAVQWDGCCNVVFVKHTETMYQPYKVTLGPQMGEHYVVESGLPAGETIVTRGSFLLKTEILKGNIGAGCCEVDPGATRSAEEG